MHDSADLSATLLRASPTPHKASLGTKERIKDDSDDSSVRCSAAAWVGTRLRVLGVSGLASSHSDPFVRVLFHLPSQSKARAESRKSKVVSLANENAECRRKRDPSGRYTAIWEDHTLPNSSNLHEEELDGESVFALPPALQCVEIQVWNRFSNGFDMFLGATTVAIASLRRQLLQEQQDDDGQTPASVSPSILRAPVTWYPLLPSSGDSDRARGRERAMLSVQLDVRFISDPRAFAIRQKTAREIVAEKLQRDGSSVSDQTDRKQTKQHIPDPAFAFTKPFQAIDWSVVVSTSLRHIFFHADVERLSSFKHQVLYGDLLRELHEDDGLHIHDDHLTAFQLAQYSAQYLDHCKRQRDRLKNESNELDLLLSTYRSIADEMSAKARDSEDEKSSPLASPGRYATQPLRPVSHASDPHAAESQPSSPSADQVVSQKPAFLMSYEEREYKRKLEKERSKGLRIAEEKKRLEQLAEDRRAQELQRQRLSSLLERGRQRAATTIQSFVRRVHADRKRQQLTKELEAAIRIQARARGYLRRREYSKLLERRRVTLELSRMAESEREMRILLLSELQEQEQQQQHITVADLLRLDKEGGSPVKQDVSLLVSTWRKLRRIFILAQASSATADEENREEKGYWAVFAKLDARQDGVLDRAELRLGVRSFGIRIDRKLTRMLIALARAKCSAPPQPLHLSYPQFVKGFDLLSRKQVGAETPPSNKHYNNIAEDMQSSDVMKDLLRAEADVKHGGSDEEEKEEEDPVAIASHAVATLRRKIIEAATLHLEAHGASTANYRAFRDALAFVFQEFDSDGNGELDMSELVSCVQSIGLGLSHENLALLRDCFGCEGGDDDRISIADFISFALARPGEVDGETLDLVGSRIRELVLQRARVARQQTESIEDAVRLVFRRAYPSKSRRACSVKVFTKTLSGLQLGVKPAQLARLVMRLDKDNDGSISFDELLLWLRLRSTSEPSESATCPSESLLGGSDTAEQRYGRVNKARATTNRVRSLLHQLAGVNSAVVVPTAPVVAWRPALLQVFREIDLNDSKKITKDEIANFLASKNDLADLLAGVSEDTALSPSHLANTIGDTIDVDRNGVITLDEWMMFLGPSQQQVDNRGSHQQELTADIFAMVNSVRVALQEVMEDETALVDWFHGLSGALSLPSASAATANGDHQPQMKVRVGAFKAALRAKLGTSSLPPLAIDEAVKRLDSDHSGWVTTSELHRWTFPPRDLEALVQVVTDCWRHEEERAGEDFALTLYSHFDADGNGVLAQREIRGGFASFGLRFTSEEVAALTQAFDSDRDGCWSKPEFLAFVYKLFPQSIFRTTSASPSFDTAVDDGVDDAGDSVQDRETIKIAKQSSEDAEAPVERVIEEYENEGFLSSSSSSHAESSAASNRSSAAEQNIAEYSEDFD